jgi:hypothetical protein
MNYIHSHVPSTVKLGFQDEENMAFTADQL